MSIESEILRATQFAARKHTRQRRKDLAHSPYINHPIAVAAILSVEAGISDLATLQAALLHDTVEDTDTSIEDLKGEFGAEVAGLVAEMTDDKDLPSDQRKALQIEHAPSLSEKACLVKIADKIANLRDVALAKPRGWSQKRCTEYFDWAQAVVNRIPHRHPILQKLFEEVCARNPL